MNTTASMTPAASVVELEQQAVELALGRIFRLMSRPFQPGDIEQYEAARRVVLECAGITPADYTHDYGRDRLKGAQGDAA